jgi:D-threo-aldose 1-dehydrogenase
MERHPTAGPLARETRPLGSTAVQVSRLSLGTAPLGGMGQSVPDQVATEVVRTALDAGLLYVDTAPHYGRGVAEQRLSRALAGRPRDGFVLSTKVGRLIEPVDGPADTTEFQDAGATKAVFDFSADGVKRSLSDSSAWGSTGSMSSSSTTPTTTPIRRSARPTPCWRSGATRVWSVRSGSG